MFSSRPISGTKRNAFPPQPKPKRRESVGNGGEPAVTHRVLVVPEKGEEGLSSEVLLEKCTGKKPADVDILNGNGMKWTFGSQISVHFGHWPPLAAGIVPSSRPWKPRGSPGTWPRCGSGSHHPRRTASTAERDSFERPR